MITYPKVFSRFLPNLIHILAIPAFFLVSALVYDPAALDRLLQTGEGYPHPENIRHFNAVICFAILLGTMTVTRLPFYFLRKRLDMTLWRYFFLCLGEILLGCAFIGLYFNLMSGGDAPYFSYLGRSLSAIGSVLVYPYLILWLLYCYLDAASAEPADNDTRLRFYDNRHQLKFVTTASSVIYIESNINNVIIHYMENGTRKSFRVRNSMKNIEELCEKAGFARAHRCYIINPSHVTQMRKGGNGLILADMEGCGEDGIPVSKKYYSSILPLI